MAHVIHCVHLQVLRERIWWLDGLRERGKDHIFELDRCFREGVDKVEVVVAKELGVVLEYHENNVHGGRVETAHRLGGFLAGGQVEFDEGEAFTQQFLDLFIFLELGLRDSCPCLARTGCLLTFDKVGHE